MMFDKPKDPEYYESAVRYVCRMLNGQQITNALYEKFKIEEKAGRKRDTKFEIKN